VNQEALLEKHYLCLVLHAPPQAARGKTPTNSNTFQILSISHNDNEGGGGGMGNLSKKLGGGQGNKQAQMIKVKERLELQDLTSISLYRSPANKNTLQVTLRAQSNRTRLYVLSSED